MRGPTMHELAMDALMVLLMVTTTMVGWTPLMPLYAGTTPPTTDRHPSGNGYDCSRHRSALIRRLLSARHGWSGHNACGTEQLRGHRTTQLPLDRNRSLPLVLEVGGLSEADERGGPELVLRRLTNEKEHVAPYRFMVEVTTPCHACCGGRVLGLPVE